jgi:hypothetical protein
MANPNDLSTNIVVNVANPQQEAAEKNDGRKLNRGSGRGKLSENIHKVNFKSIAKLGLAIRTARMANEMVGAYTGDKVTQRRVQTAMTIAQYGIGIQRLGAMGAFYAAADIGFRAFNQTNQVMIDNQMARYIKDLSGNNARNQSRSSGEKL